MNKTPIRKLPPELLSHIFQLAVDKNVILARFGVQTFGATSLSSVCSHWRTLILETPYLWATLSLYLPLQYDSIPLRAREYLETALERARGVLLSVTIEFHQFLPAWESFMDILISRSWKSAVIRHFGPAEGFSSIQNSKILPHLQFVQNLEFDVGRRVGETMVYHPLFHPTSNFQSFPNLRTLLLPHQNSIFSKIPIAYHNRIFHPHLTHLRLCAGNDYTDTLGALRGCAISLVSLSISIFPSIQGPRYQRDRERERERELPPVVRFQVLRDLVVVVTESSQSPYDSHPLTSVHKVLNFIECPSLLSLTLRSFIEHASYINLTRFDKLGPGFRDFIVRSEVSRKLETFTFRGFGVSDDQVIDILDCLPGIRELTVVELNTYYVKEDAFNIFTPKFFDRFRVVEGGPVFLPKLKLMRILLFRDLGMEFEELVENRKGQTRMHILDGID